MRLLIIRPQPGANATAAAARNAGIDADSISLFEVQPLSWEVPNAGDYDALILTSANAPRHGGGGLAALRDMPVYAAGNATAAAARAAGFGVVWTGVKGADAAIAQAQADGNLRLLWLTGLNRSNVAVPPTMALTERAVYDSAALPAPPPLIEKLSQPNLTALHSVRAAEYFSAICDAHDIDKSNIAIVAYSAEIANAAGLGWATSLIADAPNDDALLLKAKSYFTTVHCDP